MNVFGNELSDKMVMLEDGTELGEVYNVQIDTRTGEIHSLLMQREESQSASDGRAPDIPFPQERDGLYAIPASNVRAIEDHIIAAR